MHSRFFALLLFCLWIAPSLFSQAPPVTPKPDPNTADPFSMDLDSLTDTKVTTASKFSEKLSDAPSVITVVSQDELARFGGFTLSQILNRVAGLNFSSAAITDRSLISVLGDQSRSDGGHVLILINGRPMREILEGGVNSDLLESFPVHVLERIEIVKGPGSVLYGSDAYSGVINLITKKAVGTSFDITAAGGAQGASANSAEILYAKGDFNVVAAGQYHQLPIWNTSYGALLTSTNPEFFQPASLRNDGEGAYLGANYKGFSFMTSYTGLEENSFIGGSVGDARWKRGFADLGYSLKANAKWDMTFDLTYNRNVFDVPQGASIHRDSYEALLEWTNFITFSENDRLTFGTLASHISGTETFLGTTPLFVIAHGSRSGSGLYAQHEHKLNDYLKLVGGFQLNKIGNLSPNVVPRVGILWTPDTHFTVKALYGGAFRAPSLDETLLNHPALKGDPNLVAETVGTFDIQASYQSNHLQASIGYFHSSQKNLIVEDASAFPFRYINLTTPATYQGMDSEGKYYFRKSWFLMCSAMYEMHHDSAFSPLSPIPDFSAKAGLSYQSSNGADISIFDAYQAHTPGYSDALNPHPDAIHSVSAHLRFDLSKQWLKNAKQGFAPFLYADNLTNTPIWLPAWGSGVSDTLPVSRGRTLLFGIEFWRKTE